MQSALFKDDAPNMVRQPKTDRLVLARYLADAVKDPQVSKNNEVVEAHKVILKWADLYASGELSKRHENQLQGEFLADVFGKALGYQLFSQGLGKWSLMQHESIGSLQPDAILGNFESGKAPKPLAVIELKGPRQHLDRDRHTGRTAVQQCFDYLVNTDRDCRWGIVSNMVCFRLYERDSTTRRYEHYSLTDLRDFETFKEFYCLFHRKGLIEKTISNPPRAIELIEKSNNRQREVGDELYEYYSRERAELIAHLHFKQGFSVDESIEIVQRLFDRVIFIAFCEDRHLLGQNTLERAYSELPAFAAVTNPKWQNFKSLFRFLDKGNDALELPAYNGGLFAESKADNIELDDRWTEFFNKLGTYDFKDEINLDVLGHLFEKSITELERLRTGGLFEGSPDKAEEFAKMPQSAKRKKLGIYYTPPELTSRIVEYTVEELIAHRWAELACKLDKKLTPETALTNLPDSAEFWRGAIDILRNLKIVDPACGSGAFLFQAYETLEHRYLEAIGHLASAGEEKEAKQHEDNVAEYILNDNLYGVDLSAEAVEITQLALWIRSATPGRTLATLSRNIVHGNSLVHDPAVHPDGFEWREKFPEVFDRPEEGFDCVIGNPPWERIKQQKREFFSLVPEVILEPHPAKARALIASFSKTRPDLFERWKRALEASEALSKYLRSCGRYELTARGDINTYAVFTELASNVVATNGRVGVLTPSGIASDSTTKHFFASIVGNDRLIRLYDFENKKVFFPEVHASFKFCILNFGGSATKCKEADYAFFIHRVEELEDKRRHIPLSSDDIELFNPNTRTAPIFRTQRDATLSKKIYERIPVLWDRRRKKSGNVWGIRIWTMFHQSGDADKFHDPTDLKKSGHTLLDGDWVKSKKVRMLRVYEAKMVQAFDHRATSVVTKSTNWLRHGQKAETTLVEHQNPEFRVMPRWWASEASVWEECEDQTTWGFMAFKDVSSATNQRTMIASTIPFVAVTHHLPIINTAYSPIRSLCLLGNLNAFIYDYNARHKLGGTTFGFYHLEQLPTLPPDTYDKRCPWEPRKKVTLEQWISERVLKLSCTAEDMLPLAEACNFTSGSFKKEYGGKLHKWDPADRAALMAELDAAFFILYGIERDDVEYILSTFSGVTEANALLPGHRSTAQLILDNFDMMRMQSA